MNSLLLCHALSLLSFLGDNVGDNVVGYIYIYPLVGASVVGVLSGGVVPLLANKRLAYLHPRMEGAFLPDFLAGERASF